MLSVDRKYWIALVCKIIFIATSFLITIFINRGLGVENKGNYAFIIHVVEIFYVFLSFGIGQAYSTFKRSYDDKYRFIFILLGLLQGLLTLFAGLLLICIFKIEYGLAIVILTSLEVVKIIFAMIAVIENSIKRNIIMTILNVVYLLALFLLYSCNVKSLDIYLLCYGINDIILIIWLFKSYKMKIYYNRIKQNDLIAIYKTGFITMIVMFLISINYSVDIVMLKHISTSYYTGLYSVGVTFSNMFLLIPDSFKEVLFGDSTKKDFNKNLAYNSIKISFVASFIILIGFIICGEWAINLFYGNDYSPSYSLTLVLFIGSLSMIFFKILQPIYIAHGNQSKAAIFLACSAVINIFLNICLIPKYNAMGAAISSAISYTICGLLFYIYYKKIDF